MKRTIQAPSNESSAAPITLYCGRDKSLTHRAIMFGSLADGQSRIINPLLGADCLSTISCFEALGVQFEVKDEIKIDSQGYSSFTSPKTPLDCGNSGTTARLIMGILSALPNLRTTLIGDESLSKRPMKRVIDPLKSMGAKISAEKDDFLPLTIEGQSLKAVDHEISKASAQIKSCLLLAALFTKGISRIRLPKGSRDHTERVLEKMGAVMGTRIEGDMESIWIKGPFPAKPIDVAIPVDPSSAAFFAVLGLLRKKGEIIMPELLDNDTRTGFIRVLKRMCDGLLLESAASQNFIEPISTLTVTGGLRLQGTTIEEAEVPTLVDEIPILAVAAAFAETPSLFKGLSELRVKESDRLELTAKLLDAAGAKCEIRGDDLWIAGGLRTVKAFESDSHGDHRLAMAAAILARLCEKPCCILDSECVRVSFPNFYEALEAVHSV